MGYTDDDGEPGSGDEQHYPRELGAACRYVDRGSHGPRTDRKLVDRLKELKLNLQLVQTEMDLMRSQSQVLQLQFERNEKIAKDLQAQIDTLEEATTDPFDDGLPGS